MASLLAVACLGLNRSGAAEIQLRTQCRCPAGVVTLGDVAQIRAADPQTAQALAALELCPAPPPGQPRFLRAREIQDLLLLRGLSPAGFQFSGSSQVAVCGDARPVTDDASDVSPAAVKRAERLLRDAVLEYLQRASGSDEARDVKFSLNPEQAGRIHEAAGRVSIHGGAAPWVGKQRIEVVAGGAGTSQRFLLDVEICVAAPVVVAARPIPRGAVIAAADVCLRQASGPAEQGGFAAVAEVIGSEATQAFGEGAVLRKESLRTPLLVRRGEIVSVYARGAGIRVRTTARARDEGSLGDCIGVETLNDRKLFFAHVCGIRELEVAAVAGQANREGAE